MMMTPWVRKFSLILHVTSSLGWFGAVAAFLALAIAGVNTPQMQVARAAYTSMELIAWSVIVPLCFASLLTGIVQSLGTAWGLFRHYWVVVKLLITVISTLILLVHMQPIGHMATVATERALAPDDLRPLRTQLTVDALAAMVALVVATVLAVYKPKGVTPYGRRKQ